MVDVFFGGPNKDKIRKELDSPLIKEVSQDGKKKLTYFGLAGPLLLDIIEWQDYIKEFVIVEESFGTKERSRERNRQEILTKTSFTTALRNGRGVINDFCTILYGDIDRDVILKGKGDFGKLLPKKSFGLIYLDYYGGIFKAKYREEAIKRVVLEQKQNSTADSDYVLLLTVENLDKGEVEKRALVNEILDNLKDAKIDTIALKSFKEYLSACRYGILQKIYVPIKIYRYAKDCGDDISCFEPVIYQEREPSDLKRAIMLHFRFIISIKKSRKDAWPMINDVVDICNLRLLTVEKDKIIPYRDQTPKLNLSR